MATAKKTLKLKRPGTGGPATGAEAQPQPEQAVQTATPSQPAETKQSSFAAFAILAIVSTLVYVGIIAVQYMELTYYQ